MNSLETFFIARVIKPGFSEIPDNNSKKNNLLKARGLRDGISQP